MNDADKNTPIEETPEGELLGELLMLGPLGTLEPVDILPVLRIALARRYREGVEAMRDAMLRDGFYWEDVGHIAARLLAEGKEGEK